MADAARKAAAVLLARGVPAALVIAIGCGLAVAGVDMLAGSAWALIAGSVPLLIIGAVLLRGDMNA